MSRLREQYENEIKDAMIKKFGYKNAMEIPKLNKIVKKTYKLKAHDEKNDAKIGDTVRVMETRPLSKDKRWRLVEIMERAK